MKIIVLFVLALLVGCTGIGKVNVTIENASKSQQFAKICKARPIAIALFDVMRSQVEISDTIVAKVYQASATIKTTCDSKPTNIGEALVLVTQLYNDILASQSSVATATAAALAKK